MESSNENDQQMSSCKWMMDRVDFTGQCFLEALLRPFHLNDQNTLIEQSPALKILK